MAQSETVERILDAAEQLFAEKGFAETSLRLITSKAGVNLAAVNYHFGSKKALIQAVFSRFLGPFCLSLERELDRRQAKPESKIPLDHETQRTLHAAGYDYSSILPAGEHLFVRRTANLHTGGTLEDVTAILHPTLVDAAVRAARALDIPMVGLDLMVPAADQPEYVFIEANERAGLANHEPQPTAERFVDLLFPHSQPVVS